MLKLSEKYPQKRAFITGAGSGLGKQFALQLAAEGWKLGITDISEDRLADTISNIEDAGGTAYPFIFDVSDSKAYHKAADEFGRFVGIDLLINNAGVGDGGEVDSYKPEDWVWITGINQLGVVYGCHYFIPYLKGQKGGHIINIASAAGFSNLPEMGPYNTTKAAVIALSETLVPELKPFDIGVSVVMPTFFKTHIDQFARGGEEVKEITKLMMEQSHLEATTVANKILVAAGKNQFRVLIPGQSKFVFLLSRLFPRLFMNIKIKAHARRGALVDGLRRKAA